MANFSILHISDIHFSEKTEKDFNIIKKSFFSDLGYLISSGFSPNIIIFSGDIVASGENGYSTIRNDFQIVKDSFFEPLLNIFNLSHDNLIVCPGNHDIQRSKIEKYSEKGISESLLDRSSVNDFIDNYEHNPSLLDRLNNFEYFFSKINNSNLLNHNIFKSTYIYTHSNTKIGVVAFNTAWRAFGGEDDYGKLLLGDRNLYEGIDDISNCDLKIGVSHHPFEWLKNFEQTEIEYVVSNSFDLWFCGHQHFAKLRNINQDQNTSLTLINGGTLYGSRDYFNGYSYSNIDLNSFSGKITFQEYDSRTTKFNPTQYYINGKCDFSIKPKNNTVEQTSIVCINYDRLESFISSNSFSLSKISPSTNSLLDTFVSPPIFSESEGHISTITNNDEKELLRINIEDLVQNNNNFFIIGKKESGKTTFLYYLMLSLTRNTKYTTGQTVLYINLSQIPKGKNKIEKCISEYLLEIGITKSVEEILCQNQWILFIDDFNFENEKNIKVIKEFISKYPEARYIIALNESIIDGISKKDSLFSLDNFNLCYIHQYTRKEVRLLVEKFFSGTTRYSVGDITDLIITRTNEINLPLNPIIILMMLLSLESDNDYKPTNKSNLVENIINILLNDCEIHDLFRGSIDFKLIESYLCNFAVFVCDSFEKTIESTNFYEFTFQYFNNKGLIIAGGIDKLIEFLVAKNIVICTNERYSFKYKGFCDYFIAKYIITDSKGRKYLNTILDGSERFLNYSQPLEYLTGLERNNIDLIRYINKQTSTYYFELLKKIYSPELGKIRLNDYKEFAYFASDEKISSLINENSKPINRITEEEKDHIYDEVILNKREKIGDKALPQEPINKQHVESLLLNSLFLYGISIKNCELLEDKRKKEKFLKHSIDLFLKFTFIVISFIDKEIEKMTNNEILDYVEKKHIDTMNISDYQEFLKLEKDKQKTIIQTAKSAIKYSNHYYLFMIMEIAFTTILENSQLEIVINELLEKENNFLIELFLVKILVSIKSSNFVSKLDKLVKKALKIGNRYYIEILLWNLRMIYSIEYLNDYSYDKIQTFISEIEASIHKDVGNNSRKRNILKTHIKSNMKKKSSRK